GNKHCHARLSDQNDPERSWLYQPCSIFKIRGMDASATGCSTAADQPDESCPTVWDRLELDRSKRWPTSSEFKCEPCRTLRPDHGVCRYLFCDLVQHQYRKDHGGFALSR